MTPMYLMLQIWMLIASQEGQHPVRCSLPQSRTENKRLQRISSYDRQNNSPIPLDTSLTAGLVPWKWTCRCHQLAIPWISIPQPCFVMSQSDTLILPSHLPQPLFSLYLVRTLIPLSMVSRHLPTCSMAFVSSHPCFNHREMEQPKAPAVSPLSQKSIAVSV